MGRLGTVADIDLYHWTWQTPTPARFWLGNLGGALPRGGNLSIVSDRSAEHCAYRLQGRFTWYLLPAKSNGDRTVVLDARGEVPSRDALVWDLLSMQFSFGTSLTLDHLVGVDGDGRAVAAMTPGHLVRPARRRRSPVPDDIFDADIWIPELFRLLSAKFHAEGWEPVIIAVAAYLDSEADHLDGAYLKAHVGLEAFAKRLVGEGKPGILVQDGKAWKKWVKTLGPTIRQHLVDPTRLDVVLGKFVSAMFAPTGDLVRQALTAFGVTLPPDVVAEIKNRNYPVHGFLMNGEMKHDIDVDARRVETIQTLLAALVACHVGYGGPLKGYDVDAGGHRPSPGWWPVTLTSERTSVHYVAGTPPR
ncbi:MAG TPA: hypothetical protein VH062_00510 [Polyangiaceae bacterium]|nr:hypothetical protein [Polyangiaceae bacterium]